MKFDMWTTIGRESAIAYIKNLPPIERSNRKTELWAIFKRWSPKRTLSQNALYWLWISCIHMTTGQDKNDVHIAMKSMFLGYESKNTFGIKSRTLRSTTTLTTLQMSKYMSDVQIFMATEMSIILPSKNSPFIEQFTDEYKPYV